HRRPGHALAVIATLGIGIGANTAIFSVFNWILFRPIPRVTKPQDMVTIRFVRPKVPNARFFVSYRDVADLRDGIQAFTGVAASAPMAFNIAPGHEATPQRVDGELVSANYFDVLGVAMANGRGLVSSDGKGSATPAELVISHQLAHRLFGVDAVLGRE